MREPGKIVEDAPTHPPLQLPLEGVLPDVVVSERRGQTRLPEVLHEARPSNPRLVSRWVVELHPWARYEEVLGPIPARKLHEMALRGDRLYAEPILVTGDGLILDGYARWTLACSQDRGELSCLEYSFATEGDAVRFLLEKQLAHREPRNLFTRVLLALETEPYLREQARQRQIGGGRREASSELTRAQAIDVRQEIASLANVSTGSVTKVKQTLERAFPELLMALRAGEVSIHRAHSWRHAPPAVQRRSLEQHRDRHDIQISIRQILAKHHSKSGEPELTLARLAQLLEQSGSAVQDAQVIVLDRSGNSVFITKDLHAALENRVGALRPRSRAS